MSNTKIYHLMCVLTLGLFALRLAECGPARKFPNFRFRAMDEDYVAMDEDCKDSHDYCEWVADLDNHLEGYCQDHKQLMETYCPVTCQLCEKQPAPPKPETAKPPAPPQTQNDCKDTHDSCPWVKTLDNYLEGYCEDNKQLMERYCPVTCQLCKKQPAPTKPETTETETAEPETAEPETAKPPAPPQTQNDCKDTHDSCPWVKTLDNYLEGYCQDNKQLMERYCPVTCQLCEKQPAPTKPETTEPETAEPETAEPETAEPETAKPETAKPPAPTRTQNGLSGFQQNCLEAHNQFRAEHNAPPLTWSEDLQRDAQEWANYLANTNRFDHDPSLDDIGQGENLLWEKPPPKLCDGPKKEDCTTCRELVQRWYDEEKDWDFNRGERKFPGAVVLHFTQVVWKDTSRMAMATAIAHNRLVAVARYSPKGNMGLAEDFKKNVDFPRP